LAPSLCSRRYLGDCAWMVDCWLTGWRANQNRFIEFGIGFHRPSRRTPSSPRSSSSARSILAISRYTTFCNHAASKGDQNLRLLVIGAFTPANLGDGAIVTRMVSEAERVFGPECRVSVSATDPDAFHSLLGIDAHGRLIDWSPLGTWPARLSWLARTFVTASSLWVAALGGRRALERLSHADRLPASSQRALAEILNADLVLSAGGGYLADPYQRQFPFWYLEHLCVHSAGAPLVFFSQSFGPADKWLSKFFLRRSLGVASGFISRDRLSFERLERLVANQPNTTVCADVALTAPLVAPVEREYRTIGVSLLKWVNFSASQAVSHEAYLHSVHEAVVSCLNAESDLHVRLYATNHGLGRNAMDDVAVCEDMRNRLALSGFADRCHVADWTADVASFCSDVASCELLVASRMHSAVLALSQGVPVVGIAYEEKMFGLLELFGLDEHCVPIETPDAFGGIISAGWSARSATRKTVRDALPSLRDNAAYAMEFCSQIKEQFERRNTL